MGPKRIRTFPPGDPEIEALRAAPDGLGNCGLPGDADADELRRLFVIAAAAVGFLLAKVLKNGHNHFSVFTLLLAREFQQLYGAIFVHPRAQFLARNCKF